MMLGARGVYSWFTSFNPRYMLDWYDDIINQRWEQAIHRQKRMHAFSQAKQVLAGSGNLHGIINKAMGVRLPFLVGGRHPPALPAGPRRHRPVPAHGAGAVPGPGVDGRDLDKLKPDRTHRMHRIRIPKSFCISCPSCQHPRKTQGAATWIAR